MLLASKDTHVITYFMHGKFQGMQFCNSNQSCKSIIVKVLALAIWNIVQAFVKLKSCYSLFSSFCKTFMPQKFLQA